MKIDLTKIVGYENLTDEQKALLEGLEIADNAYVDKKLFDKTSSELADAKKKLSTSKSEDDTKTSQFQQEIESLRNQISAMEKEKTLATHTSKYLALGYDEKLAKDTALAMIDGNYDKVFENQKKFLQSHDDEYKSNLLRGTPTPAGNTAVTNVMTLDKFRSMSDADRYKFSMEHPEEYESLYKK